VERHRKWLHGLVWPAFFMVVVITKRSIDQAGPHAVIDIVGWTLVMIATVGRLWCSLYVRGRKSKQLCQDGPYSVCRNPLYLFSFLGVMGVALAAERVALMILLPLLFAGYYLAVIKAEEKRLSVVFGEEYHAYCARVPRIVPHFKGYRTPETVAVPVEPYLGGVMKAVSFLWILFLLELLETFEPISWWAR